MVRESHDKADLLNHYFHSIFTSEDPPEMPASLPSSSGQPARQPRDRHPPGQHRGALSEPRS